MMMKSKMMIKWMILVLVFSTHVWTDDAPFTIGGIFYEDAVSTQKAFEISAYAFNMAASVQTVARGDILRASELVEELSQLGVVGVIDGTGGRSSEHIQSVCDMLELPHVLLQNNDFYAPNWSVINLFPSTDAFNNVLEKIITHKGWSNFTILYVKGHSMMQVERLMQMGNEKERLTISVRELSGDDYRDVLIGAKLAGYTNFVVDCPSENLELFLDHAQQVALMADEHSYIFLSPDLFTIDLSDYRFGGVNMTGFRLGDLKLLDKAKREDLTATFNQETGSTLEAEQIKTETVLMYDALLVFNEALKNIERVYPKSVERESSEPWPYGSSLLNFMRTNKIKGLTGTLNFNGLGERTDVTLEVLELTPAGYQNIGSFGDGQLKISRPLLPTAEITGETVMTNKTFKVLIGLTAPYGYQKESSANLNGNDRYEGFTIDLIHELAEMLVFNYEFEVADKIGNKDNNGHWNGMVKEILEEKADFGITDFTMTSDRQEAIDFSMPFMTLGIGVLYKQPSKQPPEMFSFMAVFSSEVWYYMLFVQLGLGAVLIFVGRISNKEWQNPVPCIEQPEEFSNQFSFANSVWLIIGSVMQQGSEIAPIAVGPRMITSVWWFFTMVMVSSYTGTLVAFLTVEKNVLPFEKAEELYGRKGIAYGANKGGSTASFFRDAKNTTPTSATYRKMYTEMEKNGWLVANNDLGVDRAERTSYAVFMESTSIEYYIERHCDLLMVGGLLDSKSYGIGMFKGSKYKKYIDDALLKLKERGVIQKLKDKWWKELHGGGKCGDKREEEQKQLGMKNMLGAFVVLGVGCVIGLLISILDMLWGVFKRSLKYQTPYRYELVEELKFALRFSGDVKPVRRPNKEVEQGSSEALADVEAEKKDELRSLQSVRSSCSRRTSHSHRSKHSRHSSRSQSVAFARMRNYD